MSRDKHMLVTKNCEQCEGPFEASRSDVRFCSAWCRKTSWLDSPSEVKLCLDCGNPIPQRGPRKRCETCSPPVGLRPPPVPRSRYEACTQCGAPSKRKHCSRRCWDDSRRVPCAGCQKPIYHSTTSLPVGQAHCRDCRRKESRRSRPTRACEGCGRSFDPRRPSHRFCSLGCAAAAGGRAAADARARGAAGQRPTIRSLDDARSSYRARVQDAPGLGITAREKLRLRWIRQGRSCIYCTDLATTLDHVLPLVRGGTNHEGNLAPCCKRCNSSKSGWTVVEWRTGRRLPPMAAPLPWAYARRRRTKPVKPPTGKQLALIICEVCGQVGTSMCWSADCHRVRARNRYRSRVGIPLDAPLHLKPSSPRYVTSNIA